MNVPELVRTVKLDHEGPAAVQADSHRRCRGLDDDPIRDAFHDDDERCGQGLQEPGRPPVCLQLLDLGELAGTYLVTDTTRADGDDLRWVETLDDVRRMCHQKSLVGRAGE